MKKGFTLIELLGVIVILGILVLVAFPPLLNQIKKSKNEINNTTKQLIIDAAKDYVDANNNDYERTAGNIYCINVSTLTDNNYISEKIKDENFNDLDTTKKVKVTYDRNKFKYEVVDECTATHDAGIGRAIIAQEVESIKTKVNSETKDGLYYYDGYGNLENGTEIIYTNSDETLRGNILIHNHQFISGCLNYGDENYDFYKDALMKLTYPCSTLRGENLIVNGDLSYHDNTNWGSYTYNNAGYISYTNSSAMQIANSYYIPVDIENNSYNMGVSVKTNQTTAKNYLGFFSYDIDKKYISPRNILYKTSNEITLTQDLKNGDQYVYLSDLSTWNKTTANSYERGIIFWNYADSTGYVYPPFTYSQNVWSDIYENSNIDTTNNRIKLKSAWNHGTFPAGTKVSQCTSGVAFNYNIAFAVNLPTDWTSYSGSISGITPNGTAEADMFRPATKYIRFALYHNYNNVASTTTYLKDAYIKEIIN